MRTLFSCFLTSRPSIICRRYTYEQVRNASFISNFLAGLLPKISRATENATPGMDIPKDRFGHEAVRILNDIADSHFIAFDFEFSGIAERNRERAGKPTLQQRYEETRLSVHEYQPLQIGLTLVKLDEDNGRYVLEPYNFDLSPLPLLRERQFTRKWSMSSGAVSFLQRNGFDFGKQMLHGVPYLSLQEENAARAKMTADARRDDMTLKPDDQILVDHIRKSITGWQSQPIDQQEEYLNIPHNSPEGIPTTLNAYQRRLVYQIVQNEFPAMKSQGMGHFIQITNPTSEQQASHAQLEEQQRERDLSRAIGFRWIIDGIIGRDLSKLPDDYLVNVLPRPPETKDVESQVKSMIQDLTQRLQARRKVLIGHNCMTDVMFLYRMTVGDLPPTIEEFRDQIHDRFPAIIDTKFIANCFSEKYGRLSLGEVEKDLSTRDDLPVIHTPFRFDRYAQTAFLHEAGYDSYITAKVAIQMSTMLHMNGSARKKDHDRQQQEVDQAAAVASSLPEFGVQETYTTATECANDSPAACDTSRPPTLFQTIKSVFAPASQPNPQDQDHGQDQTPATPPCPSTSSTTTPAAPINRHDESAVARIRSAFSTTSIYDTLEHTDSAMPGDETPPPKEDAAAAQAKMDKLVLDGKMMPRWEEEKPFWDVYGNRLQVNGTVEGAWRLDG